MNLSLKTIYVPATIAGSTGLVVTQSGVDLTAFDGVAYFVLSATTSSTAGATDKAAVKIQHSTASAHGDASWADVTGGSFVTNVTGSTQVIALNTNELAQYVRLKATVTGTYAVGLTVLGKQP